MMKYYLRSIDLFSSEELYGKINVQKLWDPTSVRGERSIAYKGVETSPNQTHFKNLEGKLKREITKRTILVGEEKEALLIRVCKPLPTRRVLKTLRENSKGKAQREQYLLAVGLGHCKWYQSQTPGGVPARTLSPQGVDCEIPHWLERRKKHCL